MCDDNVGARNRPGSDSNLSRHGLAGVNIKY